jgi:hypothetical protein
MRKLLLTVALTLAIASLAGTPAHAWWGGRYGYTYSPYTSAYYSTPAFSYYGGPGIYYNPSRFYSPYYYGVPYRSYYARPGISAYYYSPFGYSYYSSPGFATYSSGYWGYP